MMADPHVVTLNINGRDVSASSTDTLLEVARENGVPVPTLCNLDGLTPAGACRMCLVEIEGQPRLSPACVTRAAEGQRVRTDSERLAHYRRTLLDMLFSERNHVCAVCVSNGHCELQALAMATGMMHSRLPYRTQAFDVDASHDRFTLDHNRCVLCARCVRVCGEIEGAHTWDILGHGAQSRVITDLNQPWGESESCTSCGKCVQVCPTGALFTKGRSVAEMKKQKQFLPYLAAMKERRP